MSGGSREPGRSVASRVAALLAAFDAAHPRLTLAELAARGGQAPSTAHRLAAELVEAGLLGRTPDGRFHVGRRLWEIGQLLPSPLQEAAHPWMQDLHAATGENVHLAVRDGDEVIYLDKVYGRRSVPIVSQTGGRLPLHPTGVGRVLLAFQPPAFVAAYLARPLARPTPHTIVEPGRLARELARIRERGYARTSEEMTLGSCSLAAPVLVDGAPVAAVGIVAATHAARTLHRAVEPLLRTAAGIAAAYRDAGHGDAGHGDAAPGPGGFDPPHTRSRR
ncbi:IclR family transcriptional regulator [Actinomadura parmotrematis]|uniref:IclR family transcriptional regulator n=1 Tax=Actinomadura parmotrematis TaxID=2864039 RepID=A0ABS7FPU2_9ACTN|nr:IclR family transcriptional regulator [Actinomadura parmotrematis]MBW8482402.1 IclR family transcriptional regulator [Actinomadura parmotrematis]